MSIEHQLLAALAASPEIRPGTGPQLLTQHDAVAHAAGRTAGQLRAQAHLRRAPHYSSARPLAPSAQTLVTSHRKSPRPLALRALEPFTGRPKKRTVAT